MLDGLPVVPPPSEMTPVVLMVLRYVELVGQLVMSGGHAVTVMTFVMVVVDLDIGVEDEEVVTEATTGPVSVLNTVRELVGRVEVAVDVVGGKCVSLEKIDVRAFVEVHRHCKSGKASHVHGHPVVDLVPAFQFPVT